MPRRRLFTLVAVLGLVFVSVLPASAQSSLTAVGITDLKDAPRLFAEAVAAGDAAKIGSYYDENAILFSPDGSVVQGRDNIARAYASNFQVGPNQMDFLQVAVRENGDRGAIVWLWRLTITPRGEAPRSVTGRSLLYLGKTLFGWKIIYDMYQGIPAQQGQ